MITQFAEQIEYGKLPQAGTPELIDTFRSICEVVLERVKRDKELLAIYEQRNLASCDPEFHLLVQDVIYSVNYFLKPELLRKKKRVAVKRFSLEAKLKDAQLKEMPPVDYIKKAEEHKKLGDAGEAFVYQYELAEVKKYGFSPELVRWEAKRTGDGLGYDILSYEPDGKPKYIEVKTTEGPEKETIFITANELEKSKLCSENYYLYRVYDFDKETMSGKISINKGSLEKFCLSPYIYKVDFK